MQAVRDRAKIAYSNRRKELVAAMEKTTIKDVAALAGVSIATVSRVVHGQESVAPEYVQKVHDAMAQLNWRPNSIAQKLRSERTRTIGVILPTTIDPFFGSIADSIICSCAEQSLNVMTLISRKGSVYDEVTQFRRLADAGVDGAIYCSISKPDTEAFERYCANIPVVVCSRHDLFKGRTHVYFNHQKGGYLATKHLLEMGHRRIALIVGVFGNNFKCAEDLQPYLDKPVLAGPFSGIDKYIGARMALDEFGVNFDPELLEFIDLGNAYEDGYSAMQRLLSKTTDIDAVFCSNDLSANGAIRMLTQQRINVPEDVSVMGYDNGIMATCTRPQLSTVVQDTEKLGIECVRCMKKLLNNEPCADVEIDVQLIIRQSSCRKKSKSADVRY